MQEVHTYSDGFATWRLNTRTGVLSRCVDGVTDYPEGSDADKARRVFANRAKSAAARKARDSAMRDLGLVKVRGALGGTYWE